MSTARSALTLLRRLPGDQPARPLASRGSHGRSLAARHPDLAFYAIAGVLVVVLAPLLTNPLYAVAGVALMAAGLIAWRTPAVPLGLVGIPPLVDAIVGSDPLPSGGFTFLFSAWITAAVGFAVLRGRGRLAVRTLLTSAAVLGSFALLGIMLMRLGVSPDETYGGQKVQLYAADVLIVLVGAVLVGTRSRYVNVFILAVLATDGTGAVIFLYKLLSGTALTVFSGRLSLAAAEYPIDMGRASADGLLLAVFTVINTNRRQLRLAAIAIAPVLIVALISAGSRGPVVAFAFGLLALLGLSATSRRARRRLGLVAAAFLIATIVVPLVVPSSSIARALSTIIGSASGLSSNGRSQVWATALASFSHHLAIGIGTGGGATLVPGLLYPHNLFLEVAVETGLVGLAALAVALLGFGRAFAHCWSRSRGEDRLVTALAMSMFLTAFINAQFSDPIQTNGNVWLWGGIAVGMAARLAVRCPPPRLAPST